MSFADSGFATVTTNGPRSAEIVWPLEFTVSGAPPSYVVGVGPCDPGGEFRWDGAVPPLRTGDLAGSWLRPMGQGAPRAFGQGMTCAFTAGGGHVSFGCGGGCGCGGCAATGDYLLEGAAFELPLLLCRFAFRRFPWMALRRSATAADGD